MISQVQLSIIFPKKEIMIKILTKIISFVSIYKLCTLSNVFDIRLKNQEILPHFCIKFKLSQNLMYKFWNLWQIFSSILATFHLIFNFHFHFTVLGVLLSANFELNRINGKKVELPKLMNNLNRLGKFNLDFESMMT